MAGDMCRYDLCLMCPESDAVQHKLDQGPESYIKESISRNLEIKLMYTTEQKVTHRHWKQTAGERNAGEEQDGGWDEETCTSMYKLDKQQGYIVQHRELLKRVNIQTWESA